jgi:hypothetical protein
MHQSGGEMRTAKVLLAMILVSSLMASVRWVNAASNTADYRLTKKVVLGGEGGWDYFEIDPTTSHVFIPRGDHILVVDSSGTQLTDVHNAHDSHAIVLDVGLSLTVGPSRPKEAGCCCEKSRNASESCASLPPASGIIGIPI